MGKKKKKKVHAEKESGYWQEIVSPHATREAMPVAGKWQLTDYQNWAHTSVNVEFTHNGTRYRGTAYPVGDAG